MFTGILERKNISSHIFTSRVALQGDQMKQTNHNIDNIIINQSVGEPRLLSFVITDNTIQKCTSSSAKNNLPLDKGNEQEINITPSTYPTPSPNLPLHRTYPSTYPTLQLYKVTLCGLHLELLLCIVFLHKILP